MSDLSTDQEAVRVWLAAAAGIDLELVWLENEDFPRPTGGYMTLMSLGEAANGLPERIDSIDGADHISTVTDTVTQTWSVRGFGSASWGWADKIRRAWLCMLGPTATLVAGGVVPQTASPVTNVVTFLDTGDEPRWAVTLTSHAQRSTVYEDVDGATSIVVHVQLVREPDTVVAERTFTVEE